MRTRFLQLELDKHKVPQPYSRAGEYARSLTDFGMTLVEKCGSMRGEEA
jgi:hypothetical protein